MSEDPRAEIYAAPLEEFTARRNAVAEKTKSAGDEDLAAAIKSLRKPKLSAWAVNQLAFTTGEQLEALIDLTVEAESASDADSLRDLGARRQRLIRSLADAASRILVEGGHSASANTVQEIVQTLQATSDLDAREQLVRGQLSEPLVPTGFGSFGDLGGMDVEDEIVDPEAERRAEQIRALGEELSEAKRKARAARHEADRAKARAEQAEAAATKAERDAERLEEKLIDLKGS